MIAKAPQPQADWERDEEYRNSPKKYVWIKATISALVPAEVISLSLLGEDGEQLSSTFASCVSPDDFNSRNQNSEDGSFWHVENLESALLHDRGQGTTEIQELEMRTYEREIV